MDRLVITGLSAAAGLASLGFFIRIGLAANRTDWGSLWLNCTSGWVRLFCRYYHRLSAPPIPLPASGGAIVAANHISGLDPLLLMSLSRRPLRFLIAREEYERWWLRPFARAMGAIPVDRDHRPERALREALLALARGEVVALFPHGKILVPGDDPLRIKHGATRLAHKSRCPVFAVHIEGVRAKGSTLIPVFLRARPRVSIQGEVSLLGLDLEAGSSYLASLLNDFCAASAGSSG